jgi:hypothetical protein
MLLDQVIKHLYREVGVFVVLLCYSLAGIADLFCLHVKCFLDISMSLLLGFLCI